MPLYSRTTIRLSRHHALTNFSKVGLNFNIHSELGQTKLPSTNCSIKRLLLLLRSSDSKLYWQTQAMRKTRHKCLILHCLSEFIHFSLLEQIATASFRKLGLSFVKHKCSTQRIHLIHFHKVGLNLATQVQLSEFIYFTSARWDSTSLHTSAQLSEFIHPTSISNDKQRLSSQIAMFE